MLDGFVVRLSFGFFKVYFGSALRQKGGDLAHNLQCSKLIPNK